MKKYLLSIVAIAALSISAMGTENSIEQKKSENSFLNDLSIDGFIRYRIQQFDGWNQKAYGENGSNGLKAKGFTSETDDTASLIQLVAGVTYKPTSDITVKFDMKDSRTHGWSLSQENPGNKNTLGKDLWEKDEGYVMNSQEEYYEVNDAFVEVKNLFTDGLTAKVGRQSIRFGDNRIFGPGENGNTGRWRWDAAKFDYKWDKNFVSIWYGGTKVHDPETSSFPDDHEYRGIGFYSHFQTTKTGAIEPFYASRKSTSELFSGKDGVKGKRDNFWVGARVYDDNVFNFYYDVTYAHMGGEQANVDTDAFGYAATIGYKFKSIPSKPMFDYSRIYASGEKGGLSDGEQSRFDFAYGSNDRVFGWMNIVSWNNIIDDEFKVTFKPTDKLKIAVDHHFYKLAEAEQGMTTLGKIGAGGANLGADDIGQESNIEVIYKYRKDLVFKAWAAYFTPDDAIKNDTKKGDTNNASWAALQVQYYFSTKL